MNVDTSARLILYAQNEFGGRHDKTAEGVIRFGENPIVAVVDRAKAGKTIYQVLGFGSDAPVVATVAEAAALGADAMLIGCAFTGGNIPSDWRADILEAIENKLDVINGLHDFLSEDSEMSALAKLKGTRLIDLRKPPEGTPVSRGRVREIEAYPVLTVGSDCSVGKMTASLELHREAKKRGIRSRFLATGQTGIMIAGSGIAVDRVIGDFMGGAMEELVLEHANEEILWVEGQGSIVHPGFSGVTCSLLHGTAPAAMILCHEANRQKIKETDFPIPELTEFIEIYETLASHVRPAKILGVCLNTRKLSEEDARAAVKETAGKTGLPCTDPVRFGCVELVDVVEAAWRANHKKAVKA